MHVPLPLYRQWWAGALLGASLVALGTSGLYAAWHPRYALQWGFLASLALAYVLGSLRNLLACNRRFDSREVLPALGLGNSLSVVRGVLAALLAGFLFIPRPPGLLAWAPGALFLAIAVGDFMDGYLARVYDGVTVLGAKLDLSYDSFAILVATALAVQYGQVPLPYLALGFAHYLFHGYVALRRRWGQPVHPLPPSRHRRFFAGCFMGFLAVVLAPAFAPPATVLAGVLFGLPVALGFVRDGLVMTGRIDSASRRYRWYRARLHAVLFRALPVGARGVAVVASSLLLKRGLEAPTPPLLVYGLAGLAVLAAVSVGGGWRSRLGALGLLAVGVADVGLRAFDLLNALAIASSITVLLLGSGALSWGRSAEAILLRRAGSPPSSS